MEKISERYMISYVAHIPHSPLLLPQIARHKARQFRRMHQAIVAIRHDAYSRGCETLILLGPYPSPHGTHLLNVSPEFSASFEPYGHFSTRANFPGDLETAYRIRAALAPEYPIAAITKPALEGPLGAAALQLSSPDAPYRLLPIYAASASPLSQLFEFGKKMRDVLECAAGKIGVVSVGDLSRARGQDRETGRKLDQAVIADLRADNAESLLSRDASASSLGALLPLAIVKGLLDGMALEADILNYEQKYGVGMLVARFV